MSEKRKFFLGRDYIEAMKIEQQRRYPKEMAQEMLQRELKMMEQARKEMIKVETDMMKARGPAEQMIMGKQLTLSVIGGLAATASGMPNIERKAVDVGLKSAKGDVKAIEDTKDTIKNIIKNDIIEITKENIGYIVEDAREIITKKNKKKK